MIKHKFLKRLDAAFPDILRELEALPKDAFQPWPEPDLVAGSWDVFGLYYQGKKLVENCARCPMTTAAVEAIPRMITAGFSRMGPHTNIKTHTGFNKAVLRCHMGIIVPLLCGLKVGQKTFYWIPGRSFTFDDTKRHSAWNHSVRPRTILLVDFIRKKPVLHSRTAVRVL